MIKFALVGATSLSLMLVTPAMARSPYHARAHAVGRVVAANVEPTLPIENALRWGYSQGYSYYPSGFGGLYGDGRYPGNVVANDHHRFR
jgi:hypothetical protein